jgi:hypothetical protein
MLRRPKRSKNEIVAPKKEEEEGDDDDVTIRDYFPKPKGVRKK